MQKTPVIKSCSSPTRRSRASPAHRHQRGPGFAQGFRVRSRATVSTTIAALNSPTQFFSRGIIHTAADATLLLLQDQRARHPPSMARHQRVSRASAAADRRQHRYYSTAYYYNLGDLGFAAVMMRIKFPILGPGYDTAFQVTNYRSFGRCCLRSRRGCHGVHGQFPAHRCLRAPAQAATRAFTFTTARTREEATSTVPASRGSLSLCVMCDGGTLTTPVIRTAPQTPGSCFLPSDFGKGHLSSEDEVQ